MRSAQSVNNYRNKRSTLSLTLIIALFASLVSHSQTLTYDFSKGTFIANDLTDKGKVKPVPINGFAIIKIINVNTFRYQVEIKGRSIEYVTQVPSELQTLFRLPTQEADKTAAAEGLNQVQQGSGKTENLLSSTVAENRQKVAQFRSLQNDIRSFQNDLRGKKATKQQLASLNTMTFDADLARDETQQLSTFEAELTKLNTAAKKFRDVATEIVNYKLRRIELVNAVKQNWASYTDLKANVPTPLPATTLQATYRNFHDYYSEVITTGSNAKSAANDNQKLLVEEILKTLKDGHDKITEESFLSLIGDIIVLQQSIEDKNSFTVTSPPIQVDGDFVAFNIKATPVKANDLMNFISEKTFPIEVPTKGGWKADFSVGPTASFGHGAKDEMYYLEEVAGKDSVILRSRENNNAISPGLAAMMHFYKRTGTDLSLAGMFGVGAGFQSVDDASFSLYGGVSLVMGKRQKIIVSSGVSYLKVARLKSEEFVVGKQYDVTKIELPDVTESVFKPSFFISISYNLTNRIEIK